MDPLRLRVNAFKDDGDELYLNVCTPFKVNEVNALYEVNELMYFAMLRQLM